ncbi:MAG: hypothetical protein JSR58_01570 [Verrucomicrobia bacterium]|nr:hypothetical protein [Verrucomicrobiota bacterium]
MNTFFGQAQEWLRCRVPSLPGDAVPSIVKSFAYSFSVSFVLSRGNLVAGLNGGFLGVCAVVIQVVCLVLLKKGNERFESGTFSTFDQGLAFMTAVVVIGSMGNVKAKTSLFFSLLPVLLQTTGWSGIKTFPLCVVI